VRQLVYAACFFEVGLLLVVLPWTVFWDRNYLFDAMPLLRDLTQSPYLRGAVSGLGVLNFGLGIVEVMAFVGSRLDHRSRGPADVAASGDLFRN
jgi:hypothetical protein